MNKTRKDFVMNFLSNYRSKENSDTSFERSNNSNSNESESLFFELLNIDTLLAFSNELHLDDSSNEHELQTNDRNISTSSILDISI